MPSGGGGFPLGGGMRLGGGAIIIIVIVSLLFGVNPLEILGMMEGGGPVVAPQTQPVPAGPHVPARPVPEAIVAIVGDKLDVRPRCSDGHADRPRRSCPPAPLRRRQCEAPRDRSIARTTEGLSRHRVFPRIAKPLRRAWRFRAGLRIAREIATTQNQLGTMKVRSARCGCATTHRATASARHRRIAAGVWGFFAAKRNLLEPGDLEEGLRAASAVGDDTIQKRTQGHVVPDAFTHGTAEQRTKWFRTGFASGDPRSCNTFAAQGV